MVQPEFKPFPFIIDGAERFSVTSNGRKFLDFSGSGMTTGYNFIRPDWIEPAVSRLVFNNPYTLELSERLKKISNFQQIAFSTSGTEACDVAMSRFGRPVYSLEGAYHGLTYLAGLVSNGKGFDAQNKIVHLKPPESGVSTDKAIEYNKELLDSIDMDMEGGLLIFELIQSDGGVNVLPESFVNYLVKLASDRGLKILIDEVYTGYGRSGEMFLFKKYGIRPDMVCIGKGMAAGLPLGGIMYNGDWSLPHNQVVSMQSANMFISKVALKVLDALNDRRLQFVRRRGDNIIKRLDRINNPKIRSVRGRGFMIGVEFYDDISGPDGKYALAVREELVNNGIICSLTGEANNVLKITPPVLIDRESLTSAIDRIAAVLER